MSWPSTANANGADKEMKCTIVLIALFATNNMIGRKKGLLSVFIISLDIYGIGSLASDPWCGFFRSPTSRPISKEEQVRDVTV
jgi:hypothetical protein